METPQVNRKQIDDLRAWFFAKDRSISLAQNCLYYLFSGGQANGAYMSMAFISETILTASATTVTFSNVPQNFRNLILFILTRTDSAAEQDNAALRFNGDATAIYDFVQVFGSSATPGASTGRAGTNMPMAVTEAANSRGNNFAPAVIIISSYSLAGFEKRAMSITSSFGNVSADADAFIIVRAGQWRNSNVISSITIMPGNGPNFVSGSRFQLYGIL